MNPGIERYLEKVCKGKAVVCFVFGARPEAIKLATLIASLKKHPCFVSNVIVTSQQKEMTEQVLNDFDMVPDTDLDVMQTDQTLFHVTSATLKRLEHVFSKLSPDLVLVQGDTCAAFCAALPSHHLRFPAPRFGIVARRCAGSLSSRYR